MAQVQTKGTTMSRMRDDDFDLEQFRQVPKREAKALRRWSGVFKFAVDGPLNTVSVAQAIEQTMGRNSKWTGVSLKVTDNIITGGATYEAHGANAADCESLIEKIIADLGVNCLSGVRIKTTSSEKLGEGR